jgi:hypothetical protein
MRYDLMRRLLAKLVHDVLPAALASLIGGFLLTHYGFSRAPGSAPVQAAPATAEMMSLLRDEHALVVNFLKAQMANEKKELVRAKEDAAPANAAATEPVAARAQLVAAIAAKPASRGKAAVVGASLPPLVIADARQSDGVQAASDSDSLLAKTFGIKDHVVAVTQRVVSAIGGIPSWFGAIGDRIGGEGASPRPPANLVSAS